MKLKAPAKLNLSLDVLKKRPDGYHEMLMIMQSVSLYDFLEIEKTERETLLTCDDENVPTDGRNTIIKCINAFESFTGISCNVKIYLEKHIPYGAGMAGDSSDGAATLIALNRLYETNLSLAELVSIGKTVGADIPFCLIGGTAKAEGVGEILTPMTPLPPCFFVIIKPDVSVSTKEAFLKIDGEEIASRPKTEEIFSLLNSGDVKSAAKLFSNVFEEASACKEVLSAKRKLIGLGAENALMTGSGSAVYGVFFEEERAKACFDKLKSEGENAFFSAPCLGVSEIE